MINNTQTQYAYHFRHVYRRLNKPPLLLIGCIIWMLLLSSRALHHGVLLAGVLKAGGGPGDRPAVRAWHRGLDVPLHEVEQRVPPGVGEVVVG